MKGNRQGKGKYQVLIVRNAAAAILRTMPETKMDALPEEAL